MAQDSVAPWLSSYTFSLNNSSSGSYKDKSQFFLFLAFIFFDQQIHISKGQYLHGCLVFFWSLTSPKFPAPSSSLSLGNSCHVPPNFILSRRVAMPVSIPSVGSWRTDCLPVPLKDLSTLNTGPTYLSNQCPLPDLSFWITALYPSFIRSSKIWNFSWTIPFQQASHSPNSLLNSELPPNCLLDCSLPRHSKSPTAPCLLQAQDKSKPPSVLSTLWPL